MNTDIMNSENPRSQSEAVKEVLLLGDSIRAAYQQHVKALLGPAYRVSAPAENGRFAKYTLNSLRLWLPNLPRPDIIHWNNGLWDTAILYREDGTFTELEDYISTLGKILRELRKTGATIVFATTTPCDPRKAFLTTAMPPCHRNSDIERFNSAACALMEREKIPVNDLWSVVSADIPGLICEDMIHPTEKGRIALAEAVAAKIREYCGGRRGQSAITISERETSI